MNLARTLTVARGDEPGDLLFVGGRVVNVFTAEIEEVDVVVEGSVIAGVGHGYRGREVVELAGRYLLPGFIDAHVHIESSLALPAEFARAVVPRGTTTAVTDPHEIANVHGLDGIRYMLAASEGLPLSVFVMASSCVPATSMSTAGASLDAWDLASLRDHPRVLGLAEVMNFPGVIHGDPDVLAKLDAFGGTVIDGHAPELRGAPLNAYAAAGPSSDHECTTPEEAIEKLRLGLTVFLREATNAHNLTDLVPAITPGNARRVALCTDDRQPPDLLDAGGIDEMLRMLVAEGIDPLDALRMATLNPAEYFKLGDRGAIGPGRRADLVITPDLEGFQAEAVYSGGACVAVDGRPVAWPDPPCPTPPRPSMQVDWPSLSLEIPAREGSLRVIRAVPDQILTASEVAVPTVQGQLVAADPARDLLKVAVLERHQGTGRVALGLVAGMGLERGAMAGTVAHDHHNLIVIGADDESMMTASRRVAHMEGGLAVARGAEVLASLALPIGGLMSDEPIERIREQLDGVVRAARELGSPLHDPFMAMSFLALEVIPSLKITDRGLIDVDSFRPVSLWV